MIVGFCVICYKMNKQSVMKSSNIVKYSKNDMSSAVDPDPVVACVDRDEPAEEIPALLGCPNNQHVHNSYLDQRIM